MSMEPEFKAYFEDMRQGLMDHAERLNRDTREFVEAGQKGLRKELMDHAEQLNRETRAHAEQLNRETRVHAEQLNRETRILVEDLRQQIQLMAEGVTTVRNQLGSIIADHEERITQLERRRMP